MSDSESIEKKPKQKKNVKPVEVKVPEKIIEVIDPEIATAVKTKREYVMTPARLAALERMQLARSKKVEEIQKGKADVVAILDAAKNKKAEKKMKKEAQKQVIVLESESSEEEEDQIIIRRKRKPTTAAKKTEAEIILPPSPPPTPPMPPRLRRL